MRVLLVIIFWVASCLALSGLYYDNGVDQTVVHKHLNQREKKEVQSEILHLLGLEHRPHPLVFTSSKSGMQRDGDLISSAPRFLIDVYQSLKEEDSGELKLAPKFMETEFNVSDTELDSMDQADIIMSFVNRGQQMHKFRHHHNDGRFWFDLSEVSSASKVISAELRVYINHIMTSEIKHYKNISDEHQFGNQPYTQEYLLSLYEIGFKDTLMYVDRARVISDQGGWISFNVTLALKHWLVNPEQNFGLELACSYSDSGRQISLKEAGVVGSRGNEKRQPFMVAFFRGGVPTTHGHILTTTSQPIENDSYDEALMRNKRTRRQAKDNNRKRNKDSEDSGTWNPYTDLDARLSRRSCQKKNLYVSFRDLGWQDWIIAPDGYAAFYCNGECSFPLNAHMNASNHAIVQTLVHLMNPYRVPKPCCAPIKLSSISVLYFDDNSNVILKKYRNMVVKSCGCH